MPTIFVAGTDTGIGKTWISTQLLRQFRERGVPALGYKPVAAGCELTPQGWQNEDAKLLQAGGHIALPYAQINPYALKEPIAPHIAAERAGVVVEPARLLAQADALARQARWLVIEGAGGLCVPLNENCTFLDLLKQAQWPVLLVVGMRLGCINHALLSAAALEAAGLRWAWLANVLPPEQPFLAENIATLQNRMKAPRLCLQSKNWLDELHELAA